MDELDWKIAELLAEDARMTVKKIAEAVNLTSPAVSERIRRMEKNGIIEGYTVVFNPKMTSHYIHALISISVAPKDRGDFRLLLQAEESVEQCYQVTGSHSHMVKVACKDIVELEKLVSRLQKLGQTNTQIILSTMPGAGVNIYRRESQKDK